jgi:hypothetical protein
MARYCCIFGAPLLPILVMILVGGGGGLADAFSTPSGSVYFRQAPSVHRLGSRSDNSDIKKYSTAWSLYMSSEATPTAVPAPEESSTGSEPLFEGFGKGVLRDYKSRLPLYKSDLKDGFNVQVRYGHNW